MPEKYIYINKFEKELRAKTQYEESEIAARDQLSRIQMKLKCYTIAGFDLSQTLNALSKPFLEVGGPTPSYIFPDQTKLPQPLIISNIYKAEGIHLLADGASLPFAQQSLGAIFLSHVDFSAHKGIFREARRTLQPDGLLIWQGMGEENARSALALEFRIQMFLHYGTDFGCVALQMDNSSTSI